MMTEEHDEHMRKRMHELMEKHEHSTKGMHEAIKTHDYHMNSMHMGNHKFNVMSAKQLANELK